MVVKDSCKQSALFKRRLGEVKTRHPFICKAFQTCHRSNGQCFRVDGAHEIGGMISCSRRMVQCRRVGRLHRRIGTAFGQDRDHAMGEMLALLAHLSRPAIYL